MDTSRISNLAIEKELRCHLCVKLVEKVSKNELYDKRLSWCSNPDSFKKIWNYDLRFLYDSLNRKGLIPSDKLKKAINEYKKFMFLKKKLWEHFPNNLSPPPLVDVIWHEHILSTEDYHHFCIRTIGFVVNHEPNDEFDEDAKFERRECSFNQCFKNFRNMDHIWCDVEFMDKFSEKETKIQTMQEFVKKLHGNTITLLVNSQMYVWEVMVRIFMKEDIQVDAQRLIFAGEQLDSNKRLGELRGHISAVSEASKMEGTNIIKIPIRLHTEKESKDVVISCSYRRGNTIKILKERLQTLMNINYEGLKLRDKNGNVLNNKEIVQSNQAIKGVWYKGLLRESTIHLVLRLKGC